MFISLEGPEGCGKTSQMPLLVEYLHQQGHDVLALREPGGTSISEQIRAVLFRPENTEMHNRTEILLFQASRTQLVEQVIRPHLENGGMVICDRYADSTLAYQGFGRQQNLDALRALVDFATGGLKPDLTLLLDIDVEEGLNRRRKGGEWNRLDALDLEFYQRVRMGYQILAQEQPDRWVIIDASQSFDLVQAEMRRVIAERLA